MPTDDAKTQADGNDLGTLQLGTLPEATSPVSNAPAGPAPTIPGFEIFGELGRGGMGVVYKARQIALNRLVAIKMLSAQAQLHPEVLARFRTEAQAFACLQHPNIVQVFEVGEVAGRPFLVLELVSGGTLAQNLGRQPQPIHFAAALTRTLALAVEHAHSQGILHRDLKPGNVLLSKSEPEKTNSGPAATGDTFRIVPTDPLLTPKITDFGLAKQIHASDGPTETGAVIGTPSYMAPEQAGGVTRKFTAAVDVYALGTILYEMLTGRPPFLGESPTQTVLQVLSQEPVPPRELRPDCPRDLQTITLKCLQKNPARRYLSARDLAEDLRRFEQGEPISARPAGMIERTLKWAKRRPTAAAAVVAGIVLLAVTGLYAVEQHNHGIQLRKLADEERQARIEAYENFIRANDMAEHERLAREQAQTNFQLARHAIKDLLAEVGAKELTSIPKMDPVRQSLLHRALDSMQALLQQDRGNALVKREIAQTEGDAALVHEMLGDAAGAEKHYRSAVELYREIADADPSEPGVRNEQTLALKSFAAFLNSNGRRDEALKSVADGIEIANWLVSKWPDMPDYVDSRCKLLEIKGQSLAMVLKYPDARRAYEQARDDLRRLTKEHPDRRDFRDDLATVLNNLGVLHRALGESRELVAEYSEAVQLLQELCRQFPSERSYHYRLAVMTGNLGRSFWNESNAVAAEAAYQSSIVELRRLAEQFPGVLTYRFNLAQTLEYLAELFDYETVQWERCLDAVGPLMEGRGAPGLPLFGVALERADRKVVISLFGEAIDIKQRLVDERPDAGEYLGGLGFTYAYQAVFYRRRKEWASAVGWEEKAIAQYRAAISIGKHPRYKEPLLFELREYANVLINLKRVAQAARVADEIIQLSPDSGTEAYSAAGILGLCADSRDGPLAKAYGDRAIELLRRALKSGAVSGAQLLDDYEFECLRKRADFQELLKSAANSK